MTYSYNVHLPGPGIPPELGGALDQTATLTTNRGSLDGQESPYAVPLIGFDCWPEVTPCAGHLQPYTDWLLGPGWPEGPMSNTLSGTVYGILATF